MGYNQWKKGSDIIFSQKNWITSEIYIDQVVWWLTVLFYEEYLRMIKEIIYINDNTAYHIFKLIKKFYIEVRLLHMIWLI